MIVVDLLRHGQTDRQGCLIGHTDAALTDAGWQQFAQQTDGRSWTAIVSSPLRRAREPAETLASRQKIDLVTEPDWSELNFGAWDGQPLEALNANAEIAEMLADIYRSPDAAAPPGGESWQDLLQRTDRALHRLLDDTNSSHALVIAHGGPIRAALHLACGLAFESLWTFKIDHGTRIRLHLDRDGESRLWGEIVEIAQA